eukprot:TRINITY_DN26537_c0_g1_i2.p1 TRINITY_DN26537_c0_g1~~TRINITY_DN26537_c0_g1_i2.p1  ORF type:complete len:113 (+),score=19.26 TRINITY_DN26537_c0_g1_i2:194-532(+)
MAGGNPGLLFPPNLVPKPGNLLALLLFSLSMIKILYWNCRGIGNIPTKTMLHHLNSVNSPDLLFLAEPMVQFNSFISVGVQSSGFDCFLSNDNNSLWCFYKSSSNLSFSLRD